MSKRWHVRRTLQVKLRTLPCQGRQPRVNLARQPSRSSRQATHPQALANSASGARGEAWTLLQCWCRAAQAATLWGDAPRCPSTTLLACLQRCSCCIIGPELPRHRACSLPAVVGRPVCSEKVQCEARMGWHGISHVERKSPQQRQTFQGALESLKSKVHSDISRIGPRWPRR
ncbi:hypothetical protein COCOBI_11-3730 [Coccomyxa sp. Obi]|nr:hypothetical protein COCOBI_11-3730 [Coccomyxa sp. Obi]